MSEDSQAYERDWQSDWSESSDKDLDLDFISSPGWSPPPSPRLDIWNPCIGSTDSSESEDSETTSEDEAEGFESDSCDKSLGLRAVDSVQCTLLSQSEHHEPSKKFDELHWDKSTHHVRGVNNLAIETLADGELESAKEKKTMWQMVTDRSNLKKREESKDNTAKEIEDKQIFEPPKLEDRPDVGDLPDSVWNQRFQDLVALPDCEAKFHKLAYLAHDKTHLTETYGRIIVSERFLPIEEKTIKPIDLGGVAGGDKFITRGILFKFAVDCKLAGTNMWMYGNDVPMHAFAMKAAGHELRSLQRIVDSGNASAESVAVPLVSVVDYRGFRLIAVSLLPVSKDTICYGSHDGGKTVHADYPAFNQKFEAIFARLNLKAHKVKDKILRGPGDIEGHWGSDGTLYLLDFGRLYPAECPTLTASYFPVLSHHRSVFYKMLRPELVGVHEVPLCSDAFTAWQKNDSLASVHNKEVFLATEKLFTQVIPELAKEIRYLAERDKERYLDLQAVHKGIVRVLQFKVAGSGAKKKEYNAMNTGTDVESLNKRLLHVLHQMHNRGVNIRCLGLLRHSMINQSSESPDDFCVYRAMLFTEMAARVCKNTIRALLREKMRELKVPSSEPYKQMVLRLFNLFSGHSKASLYFWTAQEHNLEGSLEYYIHKICNEIFPDRNSSLNHNSVVSASGTPASNITREGMLSPPCPSHGLVLPCADLPSEESEISLQVPQIRREACKINKKDSTPNKQTPPATNGEDKTQREITKQLQQKIDELMRRIALLEKEKEQKFVNRLSMSNVDRIVVKKLLPMKSCIRAKFGHQALAEAEWNCSNRSKPFLFHGLFFRRLCDMLGIQLADEPKIYDELNGNPPPVVPQPFKFMDPHLVDMHAKIKPMHLVASSEGFALYLKGMKLFEQAMRAEAENFTNEKQRKMDNALTVMQFAKEQLEQALLRIPDSYNTLLCLGKTEHWLANHKYVHDESSTKDDNYLINQRDAFQSSLKHFRQALEIAKARERANKTKQKTESPGEDHESSISLNVEMRDLILTIAQVLCDWSVSSSIKLKDNIRSERQDYLWMRAWKEYKFVLVHSKWSEIKLKFQQEIDHVLEHISGADQNLVASPSGVGLIVSAIMKIETLLERLEGDEELIVHSQPRPNIQLNKPNDLKACSQFLVRHKQGPETGNDVRKVLMGVVRGQPPNTLHPVSSEEHRHPASPPFHRAAHRPSPPSTIQTLLSLERTFSPPTRGLSRDRGPLPKPINVDLTISPSSVSMRQSPPPVQGSETISSLPESYQQDHKKAPQHPPSLQHANSADSSLKFIPRSKRLSQGRSAEAPVIGLAPIKQRVSYLGRSGKEFPVAESKTTEDLSLYQGKAILTPPVGTQVGPKAVFLNSKPTSTFGRRDYKDRNSPKTDRPDEPDNALEDLIGQEICLMGADGRYLCVSMLDGSISLQPTLQTSSSFILDNTSNIFKEAVSFGTTFSPGAPDYLRSETISMNLRRRKIYSLRVSYAGTYLCSDENGKVSAENITLKKNHFRRFGRWEWDGAEKLRENEEDKIKGRKRANLRAIALKGSEKDSKAAAELKMGNGTGESRGELRGNEECEGRNGTIELNGCFKSLTGLYLKGKKSGAMKASRVPMIWTIRPIKNKVFLKAQNMGYLYCTTTGQVGITSSIPKEPNTWFLDILPRFPTPAYGAKTFNKQKANSAYVVIRSYLGYYLSVDESSGMLTAKNDKPFRWKQKEIPSEKGVTPAGTLVCTFSFKVPKDGKRFWLCTDNGKIMIVASSAASSSSRPCFVAPTDTCTEKWVVKTYDLKWTIMLSKLYAHLEALHSHRAMLALSSGIFKMDRCVNTRH